MPDVVAMNIEIQSIVFFLLAIVVKINVQGQAFGTFITDLKYVFVYMSSDNFSISKSVATFSSLKFVF